MGADDEIVPLTRVGHEMADVPPQLQSLHLDRTAVTNAGLKELTGLKKLQTLHLPGWVTDAAIGELQKVLPAARITPGRPPYIM
jgi:hypothetical protein